MKLRFKPFFELLPFRIEQRAGSSARRRQRVGNHRAKARARGDCWPKTRRIFVDVSIIATNDAGTGIQRVVREIANAMLKRVGPHWEIRFVLARGRRPYREISWPAATVTYLSDTIVANPGDVFLGLDYSLDGVRRHRRQISRFRRDGGCVWFLVHDLLPFTHPEWFSGNMVIRYKAWLEVLASVADGFFCNSQQTKDELHLALFSCFGVYEGYRSEVLPMGCLFDDGKDTPPTLPRFDMTAPYALMVGTLEPRKGHGDIISAFDFLWERGATCKLVLVGRLGWKVEDLQKQILAHPQLGQYLFWFEDVCDAELKQFYKHSLGVIISSYGEGFGLPLIEALGHGKPVLARDLPVFRTHEEQGVRFFPANAPVDLLAGTIAGWLQAARMGEINVVKPTASWDSAAEVLFASLAEKCGP